VILKTEKDLKGLIIEKVLPGSPAEKAGLLPGDQLTEVEGIEISEVKEIHHALSEKGWGNNITFTILRNGLKREIVVTLPTLEE
jgi:serine protease Do